MNTTDTRSTKYLSIISAGLVAICLASSASASLADSAGIWATQRVESTLVSPDGAKTSVDLGPARTAALGQLNSDGVVDLVVGHGSVGQGFAVVTLGDVHFRLGAYHDRERELDGLPPERPFATEGVAYPLPFVPDWAAVGDWDSDGDFDVVFAARGQAQLFWMAGDGQGRLETGRVIDLEAGVTAFVSGDVNRRDGLDDLVVAVDGETGAALLVFAHPGGAFKADPERLEMPNVVTSLAIDWFDGDVLKDIAVASGNAVILVSGRDRKLVSTRARREAVPPATLSPFDFGAKVLDLASGFFTGRDREAQLAVRLVGGKTHLIRNVERKFEISELGMLPLEGRMLSARSSGLPGHDLLVTSPMTARVEIFHADLAKATGPRLERMGAPEIPASGIITGRLNRDTRDDLVLLGEDGSVEVAASKNRITIVVDTTDDVDDGGCGVTPECSLREAIISANIQPAGSTITLDLPFGSTISPTSELPALSQTGATSIDGTVGSGFLTGWLTLQGASAGSASGLIVTGGNATISSFQIQGFSGYGLLLETGGNNTVEGCRFGVGATGGDADGNGSGLRIRNSNNNTIGGTDAAAGNVLSGNDSYGVYLSGTSDGNEILGNLIGTNVSGDVVLPNGADGIFSIDALRTQIGSAVSGGGNVVSGNGQDGIHFFGSPNIFTGGALVLGNVVGLNAEKTAALANGSGSTGSGVYISNEENILIGGTNAATRNLISGNTRDGIQVRDGCPDAQISGNIIGADGTGLLSIPNQTGIFIVSAEALTIGGTVPGSGNLISGNQLSGISAGVGASSDIEILGNRIGVADNAGALGNTESGINLYQDTDITIGDSSGNGSNTIAHNGAGGVIVNAGCLGIHIDHNSIYDNAGLGIDLGDDGVTVNDNLDADAGPNGLQNFPEIEFIDATTGDVDFFLDSAPSTTYTIDFYESPSCDASGHGEGRTSLGSMSVITEANGNVSDQISLGVLTGGAVMSATATDPGGNTSEFSPCFTVPYGADHIFSDGFEMGDTMAWVAK